MHIIPVEGLVVAVVQGRSLGKQWVALGCQQIRYLRVLHLGLDHFFNDEVRRRLIGFRGRQQIVEGFKHPAEAAMPVLFEDLLHLLGRALCYGAARRGVKCHAEHMVAALIDNLLVILFDFLFPLGRHGLLHGRHNKIGCALENSDAGGVFCHLGQHLYGGGACANNADSFPCVFQALWPS